MLRRAAPLNDSRLGGWALVESPQQRTAEGGQRWSLLIVTAAALVAMAAVVFDIRISSEVDRAVVLPSISTFVPGDAADAAPSALPASNTPTRSLTASASTTSPPTAMSSATERAAAPASTAALQPAAVEEQRSGLEAGQTAATAAAADQAAPTLESAAAAVALEGDPASRIREYLGLHAGAQLPVWFRYEVQSGDTASSIAQRFGLREATVLFNNFDIYDADHLPIGQVLTLPPVDGLVYVVQPGDVLDGLIHNYQANLEQTLAFPANGIASPDQIFVGQQLLLVHGSASVSAAGGSTASGSAEPGVQAGTATWTEPQFVLYLKYDKVTDLFGAYRANSVGYHTGVDYIAPIGELVGAAAGGVISVATWDPSYGNWVEIDHGGGYRSRYAHLDIINVREGQWVDAGDYIGTVGNTGNSSGAHLHFEIIINGQAVNPLGWLN